MYKFIELMCTNVSGMLKNIVIPQKHNIIKIALAKCQCANHKLSIERFRGTLPRSERICMFYVNNSNHVIEDEYHLISNCPPYQHLRSTFLQGIIHDNS